MKLDTCAKNTQSPVPHSPPSPHLITEGSPVPHSPPSPHPCRPLIKEGRPVPHSPPSPHPCRPLIEGSPVPHSPSCCALPLGTTTYPCFVLSWNRQWRPHPVHLVIFPTAVKHSQLMTSLNYCKRRHFCIVHIFRIIPVS